MESSLKPPKTGQVLISFFLIYGISIFSCYVVNEIVKVYPIGPWRGDDLVENYWLDNVSWQIFSAWWACLFYCSGFFPFNGISNPFRRGIALVAVSWVLGWLSAK